MLALTYVRHCTTGFASDTTVSNVWDSQAQTWDSDISAWHAGSTGSITRVVIAEEDTLYVGDTADSISVTALIGKYDLAFEDDAQSKLINSVWIRGTGLGFANIEFRLGSRGDTDDSIVWQAWQPAK